MRVLPLRHNAAVLTIFTFAFALTSTSGAAAQDSLPPEPILSTYEDAVPGVEPAESTADVVYLDQSGQAASPERIAQEYLSATDDEPGPPPAQARIGCTPVTNPDFPHYSSGDVSAHGTWGLGTCSAETAHVVNCLYQYYTDGSYRLMKCGERVQIKPGTGRGFRSNARIACSSRDNTSWRNHVNVDVDGQIDTAEVPYKQNIVDCRV